LNDIGFIDDGWIMLCELMSRKIVIGHANNWFENFIIMGITHETLHLVIDKLEGMDACDKFDNIFGYADPTILLMPEDGSSFDRIQRERLDRSFWNGKSKCGRRKLD
jgi:hypothetical protein